MSFKQPLTGRDVELVLSLYKYRYLKTSQIQQLLFPSLQTTNRRLRSLTQQKMVKHFTVPYVPERIYYLSSPGTQLVADHLGTSVNELLWSRHTHAPKDYYFTKHFLALNQFRIDVTLAADDSAPELLGFIPEYFGTKHLTGRVTKHIQDFAFDMYNPKETITHTPDAVFALAKQTKPALFFLEIDRGTEVLTNAQRGFLKMVRYYLSYGQQRKFKSYQQEFNCSQLKTFRLLIVTTSEQRLDNMRQAASQFFSTTDALRWFWVTTFDKITITTFWRPVWCSLDINDSREYGLA